MRLLLIQLGVYLLVSYTKTKPGQKIKFIQPNTTFVQIDMSTLPEGTYILQIESNGKQKVIKVSK